MINLLQSNLVGRPDPPGIDADHEEAAEEDGE